MKQQKKIAIITGSRAEWGHLSLLCSELQKNPEFELQVIATGSHLANEFGNTVNEISLTNDCLLEKVPILSTKKNEIDIFKTMANCFNNFPDVLKKIAPDMIILLGDRYEIFAVATVAKFLNIPIVHISGGEITQGALDDCLRHSITKLSNLHFTATEKYRKRVIQLGETPDRVFNVGDLGVSDLDSIKFLPWSKLDIPLAQADMTFLITLHPETLSPGLVANKIDELFSVLTNYNEANLIFTGANADPEGLKINSKIKSYVNQKPEKRFFAESLGRKRYLSTVKLATLVIGNSSSGLIEVPSLKTLTINLGNRQKGRDRALSVIDCPFEEKNIILSITKSLNCLQENSLSEEIFINPYFGGNTAQKIAETLRAFNFSKLTQPKEFYDI